MKQTKFAVFLGIICLTFMLNGEIFQKYIDSFTDGICYVEYAYMGAEDREELIKNFDKVCNDNDVNVFSIKKINDGAGKHFIDIYTWEIGKKQLMNDYSLAKNEYKSMFSGTTYISFHSFEDVKDEEYVELFYLLGSEDNVKKAVDDIFYMSGKTRFKVNKPDLDIRIIFFIWMVMFAFILIMTGFDIAFQKKEVYIKISMGESVFRMIMNNVIVDILCFVVMYTIAYAVISQFEYLGFTSQRMLETFFVFMIINSLMYLRMYKCSFRQALSKNNIPESLRGNCYVVKIFSMMLLVTVVGTNIITINESYDIIRQKELVYEFSDYEFLDVVGYDSYREFMEAQLYNKMRGELFYNNYMEDNIALSTLVTSDENGVNYICVNDNAKVVIEEMIDKVGINDNYGIHIYVPKSRINKVSVNEESLVNLVLDCVAPSLTKEEKEIIYYEDNINVLCFDRSFFMYSDYVKNPVVVYLDIDNNFFANAMMEQNGAGVLSSAQRHIMYRNSEEIYSRIAKEFNLSEYGLKIETSNTIDKYNYYKNQMVRALILNVVVSLIVVAINFLLMAFIIRLEYIMNATELSIKKILGYSVFEKNRNIFLLSASSTLIGIVALVIIDAMFSVLSIVNIIILGILVIVFESIVIFMLVLKIEKTNVVKVLKGGEV